MIVVMIMIIMPKYNQTFDNNNEKKLTQYNKNKNKNIINTNEERKKKETKNCNYRKN